MTGWPPFKGLRRRNGRFFPNPDRPDEKPLQGEKDAADFVPERVGKLARSPRYALRFPPTQKRNPSRATPEPL